jgi:hypothetical protein
LGDKHQTHVPEEFGEDFQRQTLTYQFIDISPKELHHQYKLTDEERSHKKQSELLGNEYIELPNSEHQAAKVYKKKKNEE